MLVNYTERFQELKFKMVDIKKKYSNLFEDDGEINLNIDYHLDENGNFDYDSYVKEQTRVNLKKITFGGPETRKLNLIAEDIKKNIPNINFGICHGTRRGKEQKILKENLKIPVIGTEISYTAKQFSNTIQWDFHEIKEEWIDNVCFIFSNSLDHSYDPIYCLSQWMKCIKPAGKIYLQRGPDDRLPDQNNPIGEPSADMFQASEKGFAEIVKLAGDGKWNILYKNKFNFGNKKIVILEKKR